MYMYETAVFCICTLLVDVIFLKFLVQYAVNVAGYGVEVFTHIATLFFPKLCLHWIHDYNLNSSIKGPSVDFSVKNFLNYIPKFKLLLSRGR